MWTLAVQMNLFTYGLYIYTVYTRTCSDCRSNSVPGACAWLSSIFSQDFPEP